MPNTRAANEEGILAKRPCLPRYLPTRERDMDWQTAPMTPSATKLDQASHHPFILN
jgi:hypothetical protein